MPTSAERAAARREARDPPRQPPPANDDDLISLSREDAAAWFQAQGISVMTVRHLRHKAATKEGPPYFTVARVTYYRLADLKAWLRQQQQEGTRAA